MAASSASMSQKARAAGVVIGLACTLAGCAQLGFGTAEPADRLVRPADPADYDFLVARELESRGDLAGASEAYGRAIEKDPEAPFLHRERAEISARQGRFADAVADGERALALAPDDVSTRLFLGQLYRLGRQPDRAEAVLRGSDGQPIGDDAALLLFGILLEAERPDDALRIARWLQASDPDSLRGTFAAAGALERLNRPRDAERELREALRREPDNLALFGALARGRRERNDRAGEIEILRETLRAHPRHAGTLTALADALLAIGKQDEALRTLEQLERARPGDLRVKVRLAVVDFEARRFEQAARRFDEVLAANPEQPEVWFFLAEVRRRMGNEAGALDAFARIPENHERWLDSRARVAGIYEKQGDFPRAIAELEAARAKHPGRALDVFLAGLRGRAGDVDGAVAFLQELLAASPDDEELLYQIGVVYGEAKRREESIAAMQRVLEKNPENANALNWIGYTLAEQGERLDEAEALIRRALESRAEDGFITDSLGWVHYMRARALQQSGRSAEAKAEIGRAIETLERAEKLSGGDPVISEHLGDAHLLRGDRKRALRHYQDALAQDPREKEQPALREKLGKLLRELGAP